jgi:type VI secretion system protein ImpF
MAERGIVERLQPALLDRLTDDEPESSVESRADRVIAMERLREVVRRDLAWLLNTTNLETEIDPVRFPHVARSVLNYGVQEVPGAFSTQERALLIRASMQRAIERFEPRILPSSLEIAMEASGSRRASVIVFDIMAEMWAQPMPLELYLRSEIDLVTGELRLEQRV